MGKISVDSDGLDWLGIECGQQAANVVDDRAAPAFTGGLSATSAAVQAVHCDVETAGRRIADRLQSTGEAVSSAANAFASAEANNEDLIYEV